VSATDKCPACGACKQHDDEYQLLFECGSNVLGDGRLNQSNHCKNMQIDVLHARIKRLEEAGDFVCDVANADSNSCVFDQMLASALTGWTAAKEAKP